MQWVQVIYHVFNQGMTGIQGNFGSFQNPDSFHYTKLPGIPRSAFTDYVSEASVGSWRAEALHLTTFFPTSASPPHLIIQPISLTSPLKYIDHINFSPSLTLLPSSKEPSSFTGGIKTTNFISLLPGLPFHRQFSTLKLETAF